MSQKILIVEDDLPILELYRLKLTHTGYDVRTATNGLQGLQLAEEFLPDLILLDIKMPIMSGDDMLKELRATEWGSQIRIIILTNISKDEAPMSLRFLKVDRYVVKAHYTPQQLVEVINETLAANDHKNKS